MNNQKKMRRLPAILKRIVKIIAIVGIILIICVFGGLIGILYENTRLSNLNHAEIALKMTGLPPELAPAFALDGSFGFREWHDQTEFVIGHESDREALMRAISEAEYWNIEPVTAAEYSEFAESSLWEYASAWKFSGSITFDAWYYRESTKAPQYFMLRKVIPEGPLSKIGRVAGRGFDFALFDQDTGLFIYIDQFG